MLRSSLLALALLVSLPLRVLGAEREHPPLRVAVIAMIRPAAGGVHLSEPRSAVAADALARSLSQIHGVVTTSASAAYQAAVAEGGTGGTTTLVAAKVAQRLGANLALLVDIHAEGKNVEMMATPVAPAGSTTKVPGAVSRQGTTPLATDFFNVQSDFVRATIAALGLKPTPEEDTRISFVLRPTASLNAYDYYAAARQWMPLASLEAYDRAVSELKLAVKADPGFALAHAALAEAATLLSMQQALIGMRDPRLYTLAITSGNAAVDLRKELPDTHRALALACTAVADMRRAIKEANDALAIRPEDPEAYLWLGLAKTSGEGLPGSEVRKSGKADILHALDLDPSMSLGYLFMAIISMGEGDAKTAKATMEKYCQKAAELCPTDPSPLLLIGMAQASDKHIDEAIATYKKAIDLNPRAVYAHMAIARLYYDKGDKEQARAEVQQSVNLDPNAAANMRDQAGAYVQAKQWVEAEREYRLVLLVNDKDAAAWRGLGSIALGRKKADEAEGYYRKALAAVPNDAWAYIGLSNCHAAQHKDEQALQDLEAAKLAQPTEGFPFYYLGRAYELRYRFQDALKAYNDAVERSPLLLDALYYRAKLLESLSPAQAAAAWEKYLGGVEASGGAGAVPGEGARILEARKALAIAGQR